MTLAQAMTISLTAAGLAVSSFTTPAPLPAAAAADSLPSCSTDLDRLEHKLQQDYAGYTLELRGERLSRFAAMKTAAQKQAAKTKGDDCFFVLRDFVEWFADPHLFVYQGAQARHGGDGATRAVCGAPQRPPKRTHGPITRAAAPSSIRSKASGTMRDCASRSFRIPPALDRSSRWCFGRTRAFGRRAAVRAHLSRHAGGGYDVDMLARNYALSHLRAHVYRRVLLQLAPGLWGKEFPVASADSRHARSLRPTSPHVLHARADAGVLPSVARSVV